MKDRKLEGYMYALVNLGLLLTIILGLVFPLIYTAFLKVSVNSGWEINLPMAKRLGYLVFYSLLIPYLVFIFKLREISKYFKEGDHYNREIVRNLNTIGYIMLVIGILYLGINILLYIKYQVFLYALTVIPSIVIPFICFTLFIIFLLAGKVFLNAIELKEENDLTI